jgi:hypothetical protein
MNLLVTIFKANGFIDFVFLLTLSSSPYPSDLCFIQAIMFVQQFLTSFFNNTMSVWGGFYPELTHVPCLQLPHNFYILDLQIPSNPSPYRHNKLLTPPPQHLSPRLESQHLRRSSLFHKPSKMALGVVIAILSKCSHRPLYHGNHCPVA